MRSPRFSAAKALVVVAALVASLVTGTTAGVPAAGADDELSSSVPIDPITFDAL